MKWPTRIFQFQNIIDPHSAFVCNSFFSQYLTSEEWRDRLAGQEWIYQVHHPPRSAYVNGTECSNPAGCQCGNLHVNVSRRPAYLLKSDEVFPLRINGPGLTIKRHTHKDTNQGIVISEALRVPRLGSLCPYKSDKNLNGHGIHIGSSSLLWKLVLFLSLVLCWIELEIAQLI